MDKHVAPIRLHGTPPRLQEIFNILNRAGATHYALFGGAARDADYGARHNAPRIINDYDIRVWMDPAHEADFVTRLGPDVRRVPSLGTGRIRYCLNVDGVELDISVRPMPTGPCSIEAPAIDRANDADIGLCSIAIDSAGQAWAAAAYVQDRDNKTLSVYPIADQVRKNAYVTRMCGKFSDHKVLEL